jgi:Protein of unknown function (DUF1761)
MSINWLVFIGVTIAQYVIGALWFSVLFGKQWIKINHPEGTPSKKQMEEMGKTAGPLYGIQLGLQVIMNLALLYLLQNSTIAWATLGLIVWAGFLTTMIVQNVIWSDPKNKLKLLQIAIVSSEMFVLTMIAAWAFAAFK